MKKRILLVIIAIVGVMHTSCSSDGNSEDTKKDHLNKYHKVLQGNWKEIAIRYVGENNEIIQTEYLSQEPCGWNELSITPSFMATFKKEKIGSECTQTITEIEYEIKNNQIKVVGKNSGNLRISVGYLEDNMMSLIYESNDIEYKEFKGELPKGTKAINVAYQIKVR